MRLSHMLPLLLPLCIAGCPKEEDRDNDGDGYTPNQGDCDDELSAVNPSQTDLAGDGIDQNCDGVDGTDSDGDGAASVLSGGLDCDDTQPEIGPEAVEEFGDGIDQDCSGTDRLQDSFTAGAVLKVDLLMVVDDSGSMDEEQGILSIAMWDLVQALDAGNIGWRIGVVTTDMDDSLRSGRLQPDPDSGALWVDSEDFSSDQIEILFRMVDVGVEGAADEKGRAAIFTAIETRQYTENAGFLRDDAHLASIILSDEDDYSGDSPINLPDFIEWYGQARPLASTSIHAIVGPMGSCATAWEEGTAYLELVNAFGGVSESICETNYGQFMELVVENIGGVSNAYGLTAPSIPGTIEVYFTPPGEDRTQLTEGWTHEESQNLVIFDELPAENTLIEISYDLYEER